MSISQVVCIVRGSGKNQSLWKLEWTYTDTAGAVLLDTTQSDQHQQVTTPVAKTATGRTAVVFPKSTRLWLMNMSVTPVTPGTAANNVRPVLISPNAVAGTLEIQFVASNGGSAPIDPPEAGTRMRLMLMLERI